MKRILLVGLIFGFVVSSMVTSAQAQYFKFRDAEGNPYPEQTIELEVEAILKMFGSVVGGGLFHTAALHQIGGFDVGLRGSVAMVPDEFESLPVFAEEDFVGLAFLHGSLGLPGNFELLGRFFYFPLGSEQDLNASPPRAADSRGGVTLAGIGVKYGLVQLPGVPKIMVLGAYHALFVPDEFDFGTVSTVSFKGVISHSLPILTVYGGGGVDITRLSLKEEFLDGRSFTEALPHGTVGVKFSVFPFVHVDAAYNISEFPSFALGVGISFR